MRLDLSNERDREFLKSRVNPRTGKNLLDESMEARFGPKTVDKPVEKRLKYGNKIFTEMGVTWRSRWEFECYKEFLTLQQIGKITNLRRQVRYPFEKNGIIIFKYFADFVFDIPEAKLTDVVVDTKSRAVSKQSRWTMIVKAMKAWYDKDIILIYKKESSPTSVVYKLIENG